jgi:predicted RNA-binding protein with TRAM domain
MQHLLLAGGAVVVLLVLVLWRRESGEAGASKRAHDAAQKREPPVEIGGTYEFGITEFTDHHSGDRVAVGKVEGFVIFTDGVPESCSVGDPIRATVTSFNRGNTSADATYEGRV